MNVSLIHPYYKDRPRFDLQKNVWAEWSERVRQTVDIVIVDDGSPQPLTLSASEHTFFKDLGIKFSIFRILEDVKWNTPGALNLGVMVAPQSWVMFMDSDCFMESLNWEKLLDESSPDPGKITKFDRRRYGDPITENLANTRYLNCAMFMHKQVFMELGGFDEDFSGKYSGGYGFFDTEFDYRANQLGVWSEKYNVRKDVIVGEWMPSVCGQPVARNHGEHHAINKALLKAKNTGKTAQNRQILRFPWKCTYSNWL